VLNVRPQQISAEGSEIRQHLTHPAYAGLKISPHGCAGFCFSKFQQFAACFNSSGFFMSCRVFCLSDKNRLSIKASYVIIRFAEKRPRGQAVKTSPSHGGIRGSIPRGATKKTQERFLVFFSF
jgi:hypothetical protein